MQVIFIHHSCFLVEIDDKVLIFDYFKGDRVNDYNFNGKIPSYEPDTPIYMFASHCHQDHFDMDILRWSERYTNIKYILSKDIRISPNFLKKHNIDPKVREHVTFVTRDKEYELDGIKITTINSTDAGVAFYVDVDGATFFHAGDLNDWRMEGAGDLINGRINKAFRHQINKIKDKPINIAFIPLDPRIGKFTFEGIDYFLKNTDAEYVFPMHMWQEYSKIVEFKRRLTNKSMADRVMEISRENQIFTFGESSIY